MAMAMTAIAVSGKIFNGDERCYAHIYRLVEL
jgi:hypothetical protein